VAAKWIGLALSGQMIGDLLLVAWPNGNNIVYSTRIATFVYIQILLTHSLTNFTPSAITYSPCAYPYTPRISTSFLLNLNSQFNGPTITNLPSTAVNSTHWKWVFHCQNCTSAFIFQLADICAHRLLLRLGRHQQHQPGQQWRLGLGLL
jgi:cellobiose dehydrogenase (acceptor)